MKSTFADIINRDKPVLIDFHATWCGPCKALAPVLKDLAKDIGDTASIIKIDVDKNRSIAQKFQVQGVPTLMLFKNGKMLWRESGMMTKSALKKIIEQHV